MDFLAERMTRQGLAARSMATTAGVAATAVGLQAQDPGAARLGVRARSGAVDEAAVLDALRLERSVVRTWLMRSTVHLVAAADLRWMTALFGPMMERSHQTRWRQLGITEPLVEAAVPHIRGLLDGRGLTRHQIAAELAARGIRLGEDGQAPTHLLAALTARGVTCRGPDQGRDATFVLIDDWVGPTEESAADPAAPPAPGPAPADLAAELARRYFRAFGPATAADFTAWSGLPSGAAIASIRDELTEVSFDGRHGWTLGRVEPSPGFRLLPMFDNYLLGYRDRTAMLDPRLQDRVYVGGIIKATVVCDGRVIGRWRLDRSPRSATIRVTPFEPFTRRHGDELDRERADIERFLGRAVALEVEPGLVASGACVRSSTRKRARPAF
jgi:Winged helix DNA-binding domain